jgi:hypothetical protein
MKLTVQAQHLQIGDRLESEIAKDGPSAGLRVRGLVTHAPSCGIKTPAGKVDLGIDGYRKTWGARTEITIERAEQ